MAEMITGKELKDAVTKSTFIRCGSEVCVEGIKYDFRLSPMILKAKFGRPIDCRKLAEDKMDEIAVQPGEVVFVLTEEILELPIDIMAQLSPKRKLSHTGILTLGGFCIDPRYRGPLLIGLFNLSSTPFPLIPGKKLIGASFYRLSEDEVDKTAPIPAVLDGFPDELIKVIKEYEPALIQNMADSVHALRAQVREIRESIDSHREWREQFEKFLDAHNHQIGKLSESLDKEVESRKAGQNEIKSAIKAMQGNMSFLRGAAWILAIIFGVAGALLILWLGKMLFGS